MKVAHQPTTHNWAMHGPQTAHPGAAKLSALASLLKASQGSKSHPSAPAKSFKHHLGQRFAEMKPRQVIRGLPHTHPMAHEEAE